MSYKIIGDQLGNASKAADDDKTAKVRQMLPWEQPENIAVDLPPVRPLTSEMLPLPYKEWLADVADRMRCPLDYVAVTAMVMTGSIIGTRCGIMPKAQDSGWLVVPNLWGAIIGEPSQLKTPSTNEILQLASPLEKEAQSRFQDELAEQKANGEVLKADRDVIRKSLRKTNSDEEKEALKQRLKEIEGEEKGGVTLRRYRTQDATIEKLAELCSENPQGLLVFRDELVGLLKSWERQGYEHYRAFYLESWTGTNSYTVDRIQRGTQFIERLCLSIFGGIQPDKLQGYLAQTINGGNDGMLQRLQLMVYPDPPKWEYVDRPPNHKAREYIVKIIKALSEITDFTELGAWAPFENGIPAFRFNEEAQQVFVDWLTELEETKIRNNDFSPFLQEHFAKYRSLMPSLALIFHLINVAGSQKLYNGPIKRESADLAVKWCEYLESHAIRVYSGLGQSSRQAAVELSKKISESLLPDPFTVRDVQQKGWHLLTDNKTITEAITELIESGWIREVSESKGYSPTGGRPPAPRYCINPNAKKIYSKR